MLLLLIFLLLADVANVKILNKSTKFFSRESCDTDDRCSTRRRCELQSISCRCAIRGVVHVLFWNWSEVVDRPTNRHTTQQNYDVTNQQPPV